LNRELFPGFSAPSARPAKLSNHLNTFIQRKLLLIRPMAQHLHPND